jgi:hypothetical protein
VALLSLVDAREGVRHWAFVQARKIWLIHEDAEGEWHAKAVADIGDASKIPLPVDISISADDQLRWVQTRS